MVDRKDFYNLFSSVVYITITFHLRMSCKSPKVKFDEKKKEILSAIKEGKLCTTAEPPSLSSGDFWSSLLRIKDLNGIYEPFVSLLRCFTKTRVKNEWQ